MLTRDEMIQIQAVILRLEAERHHPGYLRNVGVDTELFQADVDRAVKLLRAETE